MDSHVAVSWYLVIPIDRTRPENAVVKACFAAPITGSIALSCIKSSKSVITFDAEHLETGALRREASATADGADFERGHGARDVEITLIVAPRLHQRNAIATGHHLSRILTGGDEHRRDDVGCVRVIAADASGQRRADQVLRLVQIDHGRYASLQDFLHHRGWHHRLADDRFATPLHPVDCTRFFIHA